MNNMDDLDITQLLDEIDNFEINHFVNNFKEEPNPTPIDKKKPSEIEANPNPNQRKSELHLFQILDEVYTVPLYEMANRLSWNIYHKPAVFPNLVDVSLRGRAMTIRNYLLSNGISLKIIMSILPKNEKDVNLLISAIEKGFSYDYSKVNDLSNENRIIKAREYLEKMDNYYYGKR